MNDNTCRNCGYKLFDSHLLDKNGNMEISPVKDLKITNTNEGMFIICPKCSHMNKTITIKDEVGIQWRLE